MSSAARIIETLAQHGVTCRREGERLMLKPAAGTIPADLIELARQHKAELMAELSQGETQTDRVRARLLLIAEANGIDAEIVRAIATDEALRFSRDLNDTQLARWLNIVGTRWMTERGMLKPGCWAIPSVAHLPPGGVQP
ncbi:hypothetical protein [Metallibacterium sp.]|uniref:hypothetical protein n=1 Tax=Metallibacterium sp. TaxID=2940281 RepID=UPI00261C8AF1|nr:hypothetical protein [Metallibacterium sp.]